MFRYLCIILLLMISNTALAATSYVIEAAGNDEKFVINGEVFEAKTYCLGWDEGDRVIFLEGSPNGACSSAKLYNLSREETCEVWCE